MKFLFSICLSLLVIVQASLVKSDGMTHQCNGHELKLSQEQVDGMKKCAEVVGIKTMEEMTPDKIPCFAKCILEKSELVDAEGKPHKENILKKIDSSVPKEMQEKYKNAMEKCITEHGSKIDPKDATCATYGPMAMCATTAFKAICQG